MTPSTTMSTAATPSLDSAPPTRPRRPGAPVVAPAEVAEDGGRRRRRGDRREGRSNGGHDRDQDDDMAFHRVPTSLGPLSSPPRGGEPRKSARQCGTIGPTVK